MNDQMRVALADFLAAECRAHTVVVFLEDLHWGDAPTIDVLGRALADLSEKPLFVLALARPEIHDAFPKMWAGRTIQEIGMSELSKKASERLVKHVLGEHVSAAVVQKPVELSAGNAFYLEELIRATAEGHDGDLPVTVVAMVQSRLGALLDVERRILRAASIFGKTCWTGAVEMLFGGVHTGIGKLDDKLRALVDKELLVRRGNANSEEIGPASAVPAFVLAWILAERNALTKAREVAMALITKSQQRGIPRDEARGRWVLAEVLRRCGEFTAADTEAQAALGVLRLASPADELGVLATIAALRLAQGKAEEALRAAEEGVQRMTAMDDGCGFFRNAFLRLQHAEALKACGRHEDALRAIRDTKEWLLQVQRKIQEEPYKTSFLAKVPENQRILELAHLWN